MAENFLDSCSRRNSMKYSRISRRFHIHWPSTSLSFTFHLDSLHFYLPSSDYCFPSFGGATSLFESFNRNESRYSIGLANIKNAIRWSVDVGLSDGAFLLSVFKFIFTVFCSIILFCKWSIFESPHRGWNKLNTRNPEICNKHCRSLLMTFSWARGSIAIRFQ